MKRRTLRKVHNGILKTTYYIMALVLIVSICAMDSEKTLLPAALLIMSGGYLMLGAYANGLLGRRCV